MIDLALTPNVKLLGLISLIAPIGTINSRSTLALTSNVKCALVEIFGTFNTRTTLNDPTLGSLDMFDVKETCLHCLKSVPQSLI